MCTCDSMAMMADEFDYFINIKIFKNNSRFLKKCNSSPPEKKCRLISDSEGPYSRRIPITGQRANIPH